MGLTLRMHLNLRGPRSLMCSCLFMRQEKMDLSSCSIARPASKSLSVRFCSKLSTLSNSFCPALYTLHQGDETLRRPRPTRHTYTAYRYGEQVFGVVLLQAVRPLLVCPRRVLRGGCVKLSHQRLHGGEDASQLVVCRATAHVKESMFRLHGQRRFGQRPAIWTASRLGG